MSTTSSTYGIFSPVIPSQYSSTSLSFNYTLQPTLMLKCTLMLFFALKCAIYYVNCGRFKVLLKYLVRKMIFPVELNILLLIVEIIRAINDFTVVYRPLKPNRCLWVVLLNRVHLFSNSLHFLSCPIQSII